ncbi:putative bifunctional diguanylate cyclase/phosphodiesterase [Alicyclobacillus dauci]|uniref:EAL domain-containing protein n=1 Tax=Alicyclobacillus dauci TaxID=1475485 RepID=A0ABY6Z1V5_9BACL|nr:EAL domain-containing protein [Alicyclobacillus dauci]WAH36714.1 EAL domain-containing protein [Alicyclobacillus dauci]
MDTQQKYEMLLNLIPDSIVVHRHGVILYANQGTADMMGCNQGDLIGQSIFDFIHPDSIEETRQRIAVLEAGSIEPTGTPVLEQRFIRVDGSDLPVHTTNVVIEDDGERSILCVAKDISDLKVAENKLRYLAYHDSLTGLANRRKFMEELTQLIGQDETDPVKTRYAVFFIDMDRFKNVNDSLGHVLGDDALRDMANRLHSDVPSQGLLCRLGGDEFAILAPVQGKADAEVIAEQLIRQFDEPLQIGGRQFSLTPSIGIAMYPYDGMDCDSLLFHADLAMYGAKGRGGNRVQFYGDINQHVAEERMELEADLKVAIKKGQLILHYPPKINVATQEVMGVEALVRWYHPKLGLVPPSKFIPIAEETPLISELGEWVLRESCRQNQAWQKQGYTPMKVSVNVSPQQFKLQNMLELVQDVLQETGMAPEYLVIELTERMLMDNSPEVSSVLKGLLELGVSIAIGDFGTGYSSLAYLGKFEATFLKIDQSFVSGMLTDKRLSNIVNAIIDLAHNLGMKVIAEGVETSEQLDYLRGQGCDFAQGYFVSRPIDERAIEDEFLTV